MSMRILAFLFCAGTLSGCAGGTGILDRMAATGCSMSEQAAAERKALDEGKPVTTASCRDDVAAKK
jgi:hypothetical protein